MVCLRSYVLACTPLLLGGHMYIYMSCGLVNVFGRICIHLKRCLSYLWFLNGPPAPILSGIHSYIIMGNYLLGSHALMISPGHSVQLFVTSFACLAYTRYTTTCIFFMLITYGRGEKILTIRLLGSKRIKGKFIARLQLTI